MFESRPFTNGSVHQPCRSQNREQTESKNRHLLLCEDDDDVGNAFFDPPAQTLEPQHTGHNHRWRFCPEDAAEQEDGQQDADDGAQGDGGSVRLPRREYGAFTYNNNKMFC